MASWDDLRYFLALHRSGSLTEAACELKVAPSTVGRRIAALEAMLGARLFDKTPEGYLLTEAGRGVLPAALGMEGTMLGLERTAAQAERTLAGRVRVTASESFSPFLTRGLARAPERFPGLVLELLVGDRAFDLTRREADLAVRIFAPTTQEDLIARKIGVCAWGLYASVEYLARRGKPLSAADLSGHDLIGLGGRIEHLPPARFLEDPSRGGRVVMRASSILGVRAAIQSGAGISSVPCFQAAEEPRLVRVAPDDLWRVDLLLVAHGDLLHTPRVRAAADLIADYVRSEADLLEGRRT